jgi:hypothetical protein
MGGSGGSIFRSDQSPQDLAKRIVQSQEGATSAEFKNSLTTLHNSLLTQFNDRDHERVQEHLTDLKEHLEEKTEGTIDFLFGGSVAKHTYVDGLSDVDCLLVLNDTGMSDVDSSAALEIITSHVQEKMSGRAEVSHGQMAVTLSFPDGLVLQILPALRHGEKLKVPSSRSPGEWSHIDPAKFQEALTRRNQECGNKLVPTIKLAKAILGTLPESQRLSGYHVESLAIAAFRGYDGERTTAQMLPYFISRAKDLVLSPITDSTGQSIHVDGYLGPADSPERLRASHLLDRIYKRMRMATVAESDAQWRDLFGFEV